MTRMLLSLRVSSRRSALPSIEPSETTMTSISSPGRPSATTLRIVSTFATISSPPLYTGTTTVSCGRGWGPDESSAVTARPGAALGTLTATILGRLEAPARRRRLHRPELVDVQDERLRRHRTEHVPHPDGESERADGTR